MRQVTAAFFFWAPRLVTNPFDSIRYALFRFFANCRIV